MACSRVSLFWLWLYAYSILYNMAVMWWCWILGPRRILLLLIASFITFYVRRTLQQNNIINVLFIACIADLY